MVDVQEWPFPGREAAGGGGCPRAPDGFLAWLDNRRDEIIAEWVDRLAVLTSSYRQRPTIELMGTVEEAYQANREALGNGRLDRIDRFIDFITEKRLKSGFPLSDVQQAFELFRAVAFEMLVAENAQAMLTAGVEPINACLAHTIQRFSLLFQNMAEAAIRKHAQGLEQKVRLRTKELAESERRYKTLLNEINDGFFIIQEGQVALVNDAFCRMHGVTMEEVVGRHFLDFVTPQCRDRVMASYSLALQHRVDSGRIKYNRTGCAEEDSHTETKTRIVDLGQGPVTIGVCRDISQREKMEAKVREHQRLAYVGHIAASLSHEIRNPLSSCTLNMQILEEKLNLSGYDRRRMEIVIKELTRLEDILHQLLDIARPLKLNLAQVNLAQVAAYCVNLLEDEAAQKNVAVRLMNKPGLQKCLADADKMEQALTNLMLNAMEAAGAGGRMTVWTRNHRDNGAGWVELGVVDNGPGVAAGQVANLFTPFYTSKTRGTGLGLANVKRIAEAHGGEVKVKSRQGRGAAFMLRLPCAT